MAEFALEEHDLGNGEGVATGQRTLFEDRHRAVTHPTQRQVGPKPARLRIEADPHHRGFDPRRQGGEGRLGLDPGRDDTRAPARRECLDRTELEREGGAVRHRRCHLGGDSGNGRLLDLPQEAQRQVIAVGAHPTDGATPGCGLERFCRRANRTTRRIRERHRQERAQIHERFLRR